MVECRNEKVQTDERVSLCQTCGQSETDVPACFCEVDLAEQQEEAAVQLHTAVMVSQRLFVLRPFISVELG